MPQSKKQSLIESFTNVGIGFIVSFFASLVILPAFGIKVTIETNLGVTLSFTVVSIIRMYIVRRYFNGR